MAKKYDDNDEPGKAEEAEPQEYGLENIAGTNEEANPDWLNGYVASDPKDADAPNNPSNQIFQDVGDNAMAYKADWKNKPWIFPYGQNFAGAGTSRGEKK